MEEKEQGPLPSSSLSQSWSLLCLRARSARFCVDGRWLTPRAADVGCEACSCFAAASCAAATPDTCACARHTCTVWFRCRAVSSWPWVPSLHAVAGARFDDHPVVADVAGVGGLRTIGLISGRVGGSNMCAHFVEKSFSPSRAPPLLPVPWRLGFVCGGALALSVPRLLFSN